ncbi:hypothetical protein MPPM_4809 [Methylorubrum populi]|uniref:Helix-turn-helix domain-containing protein n=1 Tax=Methylorubrum populi TaxID=223967 RepID=A0A160PK13_9HYPH|nr:helix-turn-helix domain-containing protein [Methylorubrum populi]BAU93414.1 hypothetical protein MPPM_4809 [Methylorubrum populi]
MSVTAMKWAKRQRVRTTCRVVLNALADRADKEDKCWPSQALLASETGLAVRTVRLVLAELEAGGVIVRQHRGNGYGGRASDLITLITGHDFDLMVEPEPATAEAPLAAPGAGNNKGGYRHIKDGLAAYEGQVSGTTCRGKNLTGNQRNLLPSREQGFQDVALYPTRWAEADADPFGDFDYSPPSSRGSDKSADDWLARADEALYGSGGPGRAKTDFGTLPHDEALKAALSRPARSGGHPTARVCRRTVEVAR